MNIPPVEPGATPPAPPDAPDWEGTLELIVSAPEPEEALRGLLPGALGATGAVAAALVEPGQPAPRAAEGVLPETLLPLLGEDGMVARMLAAADHLSAPRWVPASTSDGGVRWLLIPLRVRGVNVGGLLLGFPADATPTAAQSTAAVSFARLGALVLDSEKLYEEARAAGQARDHFLMAINHEMRTPATALMLQADLLRSGYYGELPEKLAEALGSLEDDVSDLIRVTRAVLDLGSLEAGSPAAAPEIVEPRRLVLDLLRRVEPTAKRKGLTLAVYVPRTLPVMQTDGGRLSRILLHLFANGIRYTETGGVEVRVERATGSVGARKSEPLLRIRVADTGSGIPPEELERIFEPFAQADEGARTASATRGYGLGLSLARKFARSLGGDINVESSTPRGTTIVLAVPYHRSDG